MKILPVIDEEMDAVQSNIWMPKTHNVPSLLLSMTSRVRNLDRNASEIAVANGIGKRRKKNSTATQWI